MDDEGVQLARRFWGRCQVWLKTTMPEPVPSPNRRQTDRDANDALRTAHRLIIAEHAYHLYVDGGCDRSRVAEYWRLAAQPWLDPWSMQ
jgi:hypothetical protein